jgi:hypothetical protein
MKDLSAAVSRKKEREQQEAVNAKRTSPASRLATAWLKKIKKTE